MRTLTMPWQMSLIIISWFIDLLLSDTIISNITQITSLSAFNQYGIPSLQMCFVNSYIDKFDANNMSYNYLFLPLQSSNSSFSFASNLYDSKLQQYSSANNPSLSGILPNKETSNFYSNGYLERSVSTCVSPITKDIITCYQQPQNEYNISINCNIFHNNKSSQTWTNSFKVSEHFFQETFTSVVCFDNTYLIIWADFTYFTESWIRYTIIDADSNILSYNLPLSIGNITHSFCWGFVNAVSSPFKSNDKNEIFLLTVVDESQTQYEIAMIAEFNQTAIGINENDTITFSNIPPYSNIDGAISGLSLFYESSVLQLNDHCCFLIPHTSDNITYVSIMDIYGNKVIENDTIIVSGYDNLWIVNLDLFDGYFISIYGSLDNREIIILYANVYLLTATNNNEDQTNTYNLETVAVSQELQKWRFSQCLFCAQAISINNEKQIFLANMVGEQIASRAEIYAQSFLFNTQK